MCLFIDKRIIKMSNINDTNNETNKKRLTNLANLHGKIFEDRTIFKHEEHKEFEFNYDKKSIQCIEYTIDGQVYKHLPQHKLFQFISTTSEHENFKNFKKKYPKAKNIRPDDSFLNIKKMELFLVEMKFQYRNGSVDEKIECAHSKIKRYEHRYPSYKIHYAYLLSDWFKKPVYDEILDDLRESGIKIFWETENYSNNIKEWLTTKMITSEM